MLTADLASSIARLFSELVDGTAGRKGSYILNRGDAGLLRSLDAITAEDASQSSNGGATIAAHAEHVRYGLSLMNEWVQDGSDPFANAKWDEAWKISRVDEAAWQEIRDGLRDEIHRWLDVLGSPREVNKTALKGMISTIGHVAYHMGAIRQISSATRGPREGSFTHPA